jgi:cobalamin biosynthesis protein CobW
VVDGGAGATTLDRREEARVQVECADRILLSKLDVAAPESVDSAHARIAALNAEAERASFPNTDDGDRALAPWLLARRASRNRSASGDRQHRHSQITAVSFVEDAPMSAAAIRDLIGELSTDLLRVKGFVHLASESRRGYLELAGDRLSLELGEPWGEDTPRTELVLIGDALDEAAIRRRLWACRTALAR